MNIIIFSGLFFSFRNTVYKYIPILAKDWKSDEDKNMLANYSMSTIHTLFCIVLPLYNLYNNNNNFYDNYTFFDKLLHDISISYYLVDLGYALLYNHPEFIIHHSLTMGIEMFLYLNNMPLIFNTVFLVGESTNPLLITWTLSKYKKYELFNKINKLTTYSYAFVRMFCLPLISTGICYSLYKQPDVSIMNKGIVTGLSLVFNGGGIYWACNMLKGYWKWRRKQT